MSELFLVRHAQASFGQREYDRLSELGHRQSCWLGEYFAARGIRFDRIMTGTLQRHRETARGIARGMGDPDASFDQRPEWNEYPFMRLIQWFQDQYPERSLPPESDARAFYRLLHQALLAWAAGEIDCGDAGIEDWPAFQTRVRSILDEIRAGRKGRLLVVSSGGALAVAVQHVIRVPDRNAIQLNMQTRNTGVHHLYYNERSIRLASFNNVPHLDTGERMQYITYT